MWFSGPLLVIRNGDEDEPIDELRCQTPFESETMKGVAFEVRRKVAMEVGILKGVCHNFPSECVALKIDGASEWKD